jgi:hypothetical protein
MPFGHGAYCAHCLGHGINQGGAKERACWRRRADARPLARSRSGHARARPLNSQTPGPSAAHRACFRGSAALTPARTTASADWNGARALQLQMLRRYSELAQALAETGD